MTDPRRTALGFSLVEVLVSLVILTVLATGLLGTLVYARRSMESGNQKMIAANLLQKKIEELRIQGAKTLLVTTTPEVVATEELHNGLIEWAISRPETTNENWKEVRVAAGWDSMVKPVESHASVQDCEFSKTVLVFLSQA